MTQLTTQTAEILPFQPQQTYNRQELKVQYLIGVMYEYGYGVDPNVKEAARWYRDAASKGLPEAQNSLGFLYSLGLGVERDAEMAAMWLHRAAGQGNHAAQTNLGILYTTGRGVEKDYEKAVELFSAAARSGNPQAQQLLSQAYDEGWYGLDCDPIQSDYWGRKAASAAAAS